ncbi:MAG: transglutaminase family protein, partial [Pseudomonadota bacterium]
FKAQFEFRFPLLGDVDYRDLRVELRTAIEPWHVLGETGAIGGTARYVDSSLERIQVKLSGDLSERFGVTINGIEAPLRRTEQADQAICGVRFRAWQPPQCLHPTIPVHAPLVVDLYDRFSGRALGGCTYHVAHPGGRPFDEQPVNDLEAEGRRMARFVPHGHTPGHWQPRAARMHPDFPLTLDFRRQ